MVAAKSAGYSKVDRHDRKPSSHAPARIDVEQTAANPLANSSSQGSGFDARTTKPITSSTFEHEKVFPLIQRCKHDIQTSLETAFSYEALTNADLDWKYVKPIAARLTQNGKVKPPACLVYSLLVARVHFLDEADADLAYSGVNVARADLCEILAIKMLAPAKSSSSEHLYVLTAPFNPFAGATLDMFSTNELTQEMLDEMVADGKEEATNALELAIGSKARRFVRSPLVQHVVKAIYDGDVMYSLESNHSLISDRYKTQPVVEVYDWRSRPFLDHYRLRVPVVRKTLELLAFASVFILFMITQGTYKLDHLNFAEVLFIIWSVGFALDEFASLWENGLSTYFYGAFNVLDTLYCIIFFCYLAIRISALGHDPESSQFAFDVLSLAGCVLAPRLMVSLIPDHVVVMSLGKMTRQFALFMVLAALTASGFLVTFHILARGSWSVGKISWLMLRIWLSGAFLGFDAAQQFHPVFGPILMVAFAVLSQTLLLTILISLLSNTFAQVQTDAETEIANQLAVRTMERVKSDPLSSYTTPVNIVAFSILFPLRFVASPRMLHKVQAFLARTLNLPVLVFLSIRIRYLTRSTRAQRIAFARATRSSSTLSPSSTTTTTRTRTEDDDPEGSSILVHSALREAQKVFERLRDTWDEGGESVRKVFEYEIDERVLLQAPELEDAGQPQPQQPTRFTDERKQSKKSPGHDNQAIEARLTRIEDALEVLLNEMVRNRKPGTDGKTASTSSSTSTDL
ncbi:uncharacterized protein JCM15063_003068 [Sporobolomyces koalae]|uniref:uncharacterized protein n=1 Tax=Sporobolomyces koalae TaxID=500713 RepID=UPI00317AA0AF